MTQKQEQGRSQCSNISLNARHEGGQNKVRTNQIKSLDTFHKKTLKSALRLSPYAPTCSLYFVTSQLPITAQLHIEIFTLFYNVCSNPNTKIYDIVKYLLLNCGENSRTWCAHLKILSEMYNLDDPTLSMTSSIPVKREYKENIKVKITSYHERELRLKCKEYQSLEYFNTSILGLSGRPHPALTGVYTTKEVQIMRPHLKLLLGDYLLNSKKSRHRGGSPNCELCNKNLPETCQHFISLCEILHDVRDKTKQKLRELCVSKGWNFINDILINETLFTQFILDPTSMNLPKRINMNDKSINEVFTINRNFCSSIHHIRLKKIS